MLRAAPKQDNAKNATLSVAMNEPCVSEKLSYASHSGDREIYTKARRRETTVFTEVRLCPPDQSLSIDFSLSSSLLLYSFSILPLPSLLYLILLLDAILGAERHNSWRY